MKPLGIFDSGLGGMTFVSRLMEEGYGNFVFLADQKNVPYGLKSEGELIELMSRNLSWFESQGVGQVFLACNTTSALIEKWRKMFVNLKIDGVIHSTLSQLERHRPQEIIIYATVATIRSGVYERLLKEAHPNMKIHNVPSVSLASDIEALSGRKVIGETLRRDLGEFANSGIGVLLACTHYPLVKDQVVELVGGKTYDSLFDLSFLRKYCEPGKPYSLNTTADPKHLQEVNQRLFGFNQPVNKVNL
ncbi:MAG: aspartate/glutamate racemase family protein [Erysipelotrichaceae bacterium]|jgi:glutamate racemase|nr:aspartate/glutamate racemase family protein [Erysipelotrichaceae bacterium]